MDDPALKRLLSNLPRSDGDKPAVDKGVLQEYVQGLLSASQSTLVLRLIQTSPEWKSEWEELTKR